MFLMFFRFIHHFATAALASSVGSAGSSMGVSRSSVKIVLNSDRLGRVLLERFLIASVDLLNWLALRAGSPLHWHAQPFSFSSSLLNLVTLAAIALEVFSLFFFQPFWFRGLKLGLSSIWLAPDCFLVGDGLQSTSLALSATMEELMFFCPFSP